MQLLNIVKNGMAFLCAILVTVSASAQEKIDTSRVYTLDEVIVSANRWEQSSQTVGRNVTVITRQEIERAFYTSVGDLLAEQQSVHIVGNNQTAGSVQSLFLRNSDGNHSVVMIDGVRLSDPSTPDNSINLAELSLAGVERIEIVRGSHSTLYGSSAIGGVVNIITRDRNDTGLDGSLETAHGTFGSGTYSTHNTLSANYSLENGLYFDLGVDQQRTLGLDATVDTVTNPNQFNPQDRDDFSKLDMNGKVGYSGTSFGLYASYRRADQETDLDQSAYVDDDNARIDFRRGLFSYGGTYRPTGNLELNLSGAYSELDRNFVNDSSVVDAAGSYDGIYTENRGDGSLWENELTGRFESDGISAVLGLGGSRQTMNSYSYTFSSAFNFESETDLDSLNLRESINYAFFHAELGGSLLSEKLNPVALVAGGRLTDHDQFGLNWTYEFNPKVEFGASAIVYASLTTGFNAPSLFQLHSPSRGFGAFTNRGNEELEPEKSVSYEAGWKQALGNRARLQLSLFRTRVRNKIEYIYLWNGDTALGNLGPADYLGDTYINLAEQRTTGVELALQARLAPRLRFDGTLTFARSTASYSPDAIDRGYTGGHHVQLFQGGQFVEEEQEIDGLIRRPQISAHAALAFRPTERLNLRVSTRFVGENDDIFYSAALGPFGAVDRTKVKRYAITDLSTRYRISSNLSLKVHVENLFNSDYTEIKGYKTRPRGIYGSVKFSL
ncbi:MAG: TonB-dependent receptor [Balneolaceae bacterium]|nr:TonB-dependent receptor [Balneolaceae bacterium]